MWCSEDDSRRGLHDNWAQIAAVGLRYEGYGVEWWVYVPFQVRKMLEENSNLRLQVLQQVSHDFILYQPLSLCTGQCFISLLEKDGYISADDLPLCVFAISKLAQPLGGKAELSLENMLVSLETRPRSARSATYLRGHRIPGYHECGE